MTNINDTLQLTNNPLIKAHEMNVLTYNDYFYRLKLLACSMFEWTGFPESVSIRFLEDTLFHFGKAVFIKDESLGFMGLKVTSGGELNVYGDPVRYQAYGIGYSKMYNVDKCVLIRNNYLNKPTHTTIQLYATRLYKVERTIDVNIEGQKFPRLIRCIKEQELTLKNIYNQYEGNRPVIYVDKNFDASALSVLDTSSPYVADKLMLYKHDLWNECMSFLGISNANTDKRERLITDEVDSNNQLIQLAAETMLVTRKEAVEQINKMFGLNVSVRQKEYEEIVADFNGGEDDDI